MDAAGTTRPAPCPWCGSTLGEVHRTPDGLFHYACEACGAGGPAVRHDRDAVREWNDIAGGPDADGMLKAWNAALTAAELLVRRAMDPQGNARQPCLLYLADRIASMRLGDRRAQEG